MASDLRHQSVSSCPTAACTNLLVRFLYRCIFYFNYLLLGCCYNVIKMFLSIFWRILKFEVEIRAYYSEYLQDSSDRCRWIIEFLLTFVSKKLSEFTNFSMRPQRIY